MPTSLDSSPDFTIEARHWGEGRYVVAGVDEVGRGPLAGPVVAGAAVFDPSADSDALEGLRDSKQMNHAAIERWADRIRRGDLHPRGLLACRVGAASPPEIDRLNIRRATILAMRRALEHLERDLVRTGVLDDGARVGAILVDGDRVPELERPHEAVPRADRRSLSVACAAVLAKDTRDRLMANLAERYPAFSCWASDRGYASPDHRAALAEHGPVPGHHRMSFAPCAQPVFL